MNEQKRISLAPYLIMWIDLNGKISIFPFRFRTKTEMSTGSFDALKRIITKKEQCERGLNCFMSK